MKHSDLVYLTVNDSPTNDRTTSTVSSPRPVGAEEMEGVEEMKHNVEFSGGAPLHGAASAGTQGYASGGGKDEA